jgi:CheY-like chemotaxis protein
MGTRHNLPITNLLQWSIFRLQSNPSLHSPVFLRLYLTYPNGFPRLVGFEVPCRQTSAVFWRKTWNPPCGLLWFEMRILIVDDNPQVRAAIVSILITDPRLEIVSEAANGKEALELARELEPDLILLDIGLPDMNGLEVAQSLAESTPRCAILFLSQHTSSDIVRSTLNCGGMGYVVKADAAFELRPAVLAAIRGRKYFSKRARSAEIDSES